MAPISAALVDDLRSGLQSSQLLTPDSEGYAESLKRWSESSEKRAGLVVFPTSNEDVSKAVSFAAKNNIDLAVCCGGHSTSGSSSSDGGLVIDLSKMRQVKVDPAKKTITAQGGALWTHVDEAAQEHGLFTPGGTVNHTGIGGLTLQGGYGWISGKYGLVVDNILSVKMVLADGSIVTASEKENSDLFWAVRGAGANFGVAVEFVFKGHEQTQDPWCGLLAFSADKLEQVVTFANRVVDEERGRSALIVGFGCPPPAFQPAVVAMVYHDGSEESAHKIFKPLLDLEPVMNHTETHIYTFVNGMTNPLVDHGDRKSIKGYTYDLPLRPDFAREVFEDYAKFVSANPDAGKTVIVNEFFYTGVITSVPLDATSFPSRGSYQNGLTMLRWADAANDVTMRQWGRDVKVKFEEEEKIKKAAHQASGLYSNYQEGDDVKVNEIFGVHYKRLQKLKGQYDPKNVFNKMHPIQPSA